MFLSGRLIEQFDLGDFVEIGGEETLVAKIVCTFVYAGFYSAGDGENARITGECGIKAAAGGSLIADLKRLSFAVFCGDLQSERRRRETVGAEVGGLIVDEAIRI